MTAFAGHVETLLIARHREPVRRTASGTKINDPGRSVRVRQVDNRERVAGLVRQVGAPDVPAAVVRREHERSHGRGLMRQIPDLEFTSSLALQIDDRYTPGVLLAMAILPIGPSGS